MISVERGVPLPPPETHRRKYPWHDMKPGDSFHVECPPGPARDKLQSSLAGNGARHFTVRTQQTDTGVRVWRMPEPSTPPSS